MPAITIKDVQPNEVFGRRRLGYTLVALFLVLWLVFTVAYVIVYLPQTFWFAYFSVDYRLGFVRRGLAGEILDLFPADLYFTGLLTLRWLVSALFIIGLTAVAWTAAVRFGRSERRLMLVLLIPVLPFGFGTAIHAPQPDLLAGSALAMFAAALATVKGSRPILFASACYGFATALLTLIHEAIPFLYSLGAIVAIVVLGMNSPIKIQRLSALLAVAPGLVVALAIGLLGRQGISSQLCTLVPHRAVYWPYWGGAGNRSSAQLPVGYVDYHDFVCRYVLPRFDETPADAARTVAGVGAAALIMSMLLGIVVFTVTVLAINRISGVPFGRFCNVLRGRLVWVTFTAVLFLPLFATTIDWSRWWVRISLDVGMVYLLYASAQPEAAQAPTRRTRVIFVVALLLFACYPIGSIQSLGIPRPA
jgi:hypothetical protein